MSLVFSTADPKEDTEAFVFVSAAVRDELKTKLETMVFGGHTPPPKIQLTGYAAEAALRSVYSEVWLEMNVERALAMRQSVEYVAFLRSLGRKHDDNRAAEDSDPDYTMMEK